jgi:SNF2 family DNA or RNA helicase
MSRRRVRDTAERCHEESLVTQGTIEERIIDLHHDKRALAEGVLARDGTAVLPSAEDLIALMRRVIKV